MLVLTPYQTLLLYSWFPLAVCIMLMLLIARFYENFAQERTGYMLFVIPFVLSGAATVRYSSLQQVVGDALGDVLLGLAGVTLAAQCLYVLHLMTRGRS